MPRRRDVHVNHGRKAQGARRKEEMSLLFEFRGPWTVDREPLSRLAPRHFGRLVSGRSWATW